MAGAGAKLFQDGQKLFAADVNGYLMDQTIMRFANAAARDAAFGGVGEPVLAEGMMCYLMDVNVIQVYDGSNWKYVANANTPSGLVLISTASLSGTSQVFTDVFSNNFDNYKIVISEFQNTTSNSSLTMQLRTSGGVPSITGYNFGGVLYTFTATGVIQNASASSSWSITSANTSQFAAATIDVMSPNITKWSHICIVNSSPDAGRYIAGNHQVSTAYPSFQLAATGGMSGTISIYGYTK